MVSSIEGRDKSTSWGSLSLVSSAGALTMVSFSLLSSWRASKATISTVDDDNSLSIYHKLGVAPPHTKVLTIGVLGINLPLHRWAWKYHGRLISVLHFFDNMDHPPDICVNLRVLWCKLLISLDPRSLSYEGKQRKPMTKMQQPKQGTHAFENRHDNHSNVEDDQFHYATYKLLPPLSIKWPLRYLGLWRIFPRWMHANIELRTVYIDTALETVLGKWSKSNNASSEKTIVPNRGLSDVAHDDDDHHTESVCVLILGGGYDPRGAKLSVGHYGYSSSCSSDPLQTKPRAAHLVKQVYELDLPVVVQSKRGLLRRAGFGVVDGDGNDDDDDDADDDGDDRGDDSHPTADGTPGCARNQKLDQRIRLEGVDLNDDDAVDRALDKIRNELIGAATSTDAQDSAAATDVSSTKRKKHRWKVVLISEAVLMYLDPGKAERILEGVANRFCGERQESFAGASFVFADRLLQKQPDRSKRAWSVPASPESIQAEENEVRKWLFERGWELEDFLLKPGSTRHLGIATTTIVPNRKFSDS